MSVRRRGVNNMHSLSWGTNEKIQNCITTSCHVLRRILSSLNSTYALQLCSVESIGVLKNIEFELEHRTLKKRNILDGGNAIGEPLKQCAMFLEF